MNAIVEVKAKGNYFVWLRFKDGQEKTVDLKPFIGKGFTKELLDTAIFNQVFVEPGGGIAWPNGFDFCPNFLRELEEKRHVA